MSLLTSLLPEKNEKETASDGCLFARIKYHDDELAFALLFKRYYDSLCHQALSFTACFFESEEIVSDVFSKLWRSRHDIDDRIRLKAYLFVAVRNQSFDYLRKQSRRRWACNPLSDQTDSGYITPEQALLNQELFRSVETAIEKLPLKGKQIFRLSREGNLKYKEIAKQMGISIKTVETHMRRAFIHLRQELHPCI